MQVMQACGVRVCACARACARAGRRACIECVRACVRACVCACACVRVCKHVQATTHGWRSLTIEECKFCVYAASCNGSKGGLFGTFVEQHQSATFSMVCAQSTSGCEWRKRDTSNSRPRPNALAGPRSTCSRARAGGRHGTMDARCHKRGSKALSQRGGNALPLGPVLNSPGSGAQQSVPGWARYSTVPGSARYTIIVTDRIRT